MSIPLIEFPPLSRKIPQIGLGCARLVGRSSLRQSARIVEAALDLGIRYFDVAPSYGMGTAEEVLGAVIGDSRETVVATKVGVPRPAYSAGTNLVRRAAKPVLDRVRSVKSLARRVYVRAAPPGAPPPRYDLSEVAVRSGVEESLRRLRRGAIDVYLAHEPRPDQLGEELALRFERLAREGLIRAYGAGIDRREDRWSVFGLVWQSGWPGGAIGDYRGDVAYVFHGAIRYAPKDRLGATVRPAPELVQDAMRLAPRSVILVSASTPAKLRELAGRG